MLRNFFKIAWRNLMKHKSATAINILGLALGTSCCLVIYLINSYELSYDEFHPDKEKIYRLVSELRSEDGKTSRLGYVTDPMAMTVRQELTGFDAVSGFYNYYAKVSIPDGTKKAKQFDMPKWSTDKSNIIITDPQYFQIFNYQWLAGNPATAIWNPFQVVLTENEAQKYFGEKPFNDYLGKQVIYNDSLVLTVSGIVKNWTANTDFGFQDFISSATIPHSILKNNIDLNAWGMWNDYTQAFVKLSSGVTAQQAESQFPDFLKKHVLQPKGFEAKISLQPLNDIHFNAEYGDSFSRKAHLPTLYALMGIAAFILIIAAINFINLSTAQSLQRAKEIGVRKVLGSNRSGLVFQFLTETFILTCFAVALSLLVIGPILYAFQSFTPPGLKFSFTPATGIFIVSVVLVTTLLAGFYPAKVLSSYMPVLTLKGQVSQQAGGKFLLRKSLIVFQFTISLIFIMGTMTISKQIHFLLNKDLGFKKDAIINLQTSWNYPVARQDLLIQKLKGLPAIEMVSTSAETPVARGHRGTDLIYMTAHEIKVESQMEIADEHFIPLYDIKLLAGRNINHSDTMNEFLINKTCAEQLGFKTPADAVGKFVRSGQNDSRSPKLLPIVGVVADFHSLSLHEPIKPVFITSNSGASRAISIRLLTNGKQAHDFQQAVADIEKIWKEVYPEEKFEYSFFDQTIAGFYESEQKTSTLINIAMGIAIFVSCMGLFGLATFTSDNRIKEIGIRKVLGASVGSIVSMLSNEFIRLVAIAAFIATPISWWLVHKWLNDFAYRTAVSWWIYVLAGFTLLLITIITVSYQSIKAATANPVKSLRTE